MLHRSWKAVRFASHSSIPLLIINYFYFSFKGCPRADISFWGGDLASTDGGQGVQTEGDWECSRKCIDAPKCTHWTYVRSRRVNCFLKAKPMRTLEGVKGSISGTYGRGCGEWCLTWKPNFAAQGQFRLFHTVPRNVYLTKLDWQKLQEFDAITYCKL